MDLLAGTFFSSSTEHYEEYNNRFAFWRGLGLRFGVSFVCVLACASFAFWRWLRSFTFWRGLGLRFGVALVCVLAWAWFAFLDALCLRF